MKEKFVLGIFVFSVLALIVLIFLVSFQGAITGKVVGETGGEIVGEKIVEMTCTDSDNGKNYDVKGSVNYCDANGCTVKYDFCNGKKLIEWYCSNKESKYEEYECKFDCDAGVCLTEAREYEYPGGGSGGGGGGGTTTTTTITVVITGQTYDLGQLSSENTLEIMKNDIIKFNLAGADYSLTLSEITEIQVTLSSSSGQFNLLVGQDSRFDLNNDGVNDIYIKVRTISLVSGKAKLTLNVA